MSTHNYSQQAYSAKSHYRISIHSEWQQQFSVDKFITSLSWCKDTDILESSAYESVTILH